MALLAVATTALVTTAIVMSRVGGDLGDDDSDVVDVSKLRNGVPKVLTISVDAPPPRRILQHGVRLRRSSFRLAHPVWY